MFAFIKSLWKNQTGATAIEYALITLMIAIAIVSVVTTVGSHVTTTFNTIATKL